MADKTELDAELSAQVDKLRADIAEMGRTIAQLVDQKRVEMTDEAARGIGQLAAGASTLRAEAEARARAAADIARDTSSQAVDLLADEVRHHPVRTLGLALGVGLLIGLSSRAR
jgi:Uncharacterized conserved protein